MGKNRHIFFEYQQESLKIFYSNNGTYKGEDQEDSKGHEDLKVEPITWEHLKRKRDKNL